MGGDDVITGGDESCMLHGGGDGNDVLTGGASWDGLIGGAGDDMLYGLGGNDWMRGEDGSDTLYGGAGADRMFGEAGNDVLVGGDGADTLSAGDGSDRFVYLAANEAGDTIVDFTAGAGADVIDVSALLASFGYAGADAFGDGYLRAIQNGADTLVQVDANGGGDGYITLAALQGLTATELTQDNWIV